MTREERELAITHLEGIKEKYIEGVGYERHPVPEYYAIETAIKALEQESCEDAISRQAVLDLIADYDLSMGQVVKGIHVLPPVTPQPKTGRWIKTPNGFKCSKCLIVHSHTSIFCPSCGAKMVEPQERSDKCSKCEYYINPDYTRCKECGAERSDKE